MYDVMHSAFFFCKPAFIKATVRDVVPSSRACTERDSLARKKNFSYRDLVVSIGRRGSVSLARRLGLVERFPAAIVAAVVVAFFGSRKRGPTWSARLHVYTIHIRKYIKYNNSLRPGLRAARIFSLFFLYIFSYFIFAATIHDASRDICT